MPSPAGVLKEGPGLIGSLTAPKENVMQGGTLPAASQSVKTVVGQIAYSLEMRGLS